MATPTLPELRQKLDQLDDVKLDALTMDYFQTVYKEFARGLHRDEKINLLLDHCLRHPEDIVILVNLLDIEQGPPKIIEIPIVILAMLQQEALEIASGKVLSRSDITSEFGEQLKAIQQACLSHREDWYLHYQTERDNWIPYSGDHREIHQIVWDIAFKANERRVKKKKTSIIKPIFLSEKFFTDDNQIRKDTWEYMYESGGIFLIDSVSLFYPVLRKHLKDSHISSKSEVSVLVLYPGDPSQMVINQVIDQDIRSNMEYEFTRFAEKYEKTCEIGASSLHSLQRWMISSIGDIADKIYIPKAQEDNRDLIRNQMGEPKGKASLVLGHGGGR